MVIWTLWLFGTLEVSEFMIKALRFLAHRVLWFLGCRVFNRGKKLERFLPRNNIPKGDYRILRIGVMGRC